LPRDSRAITPIRTCQTRGAQGYEPNGVHLTLFGFIYPERPASIPDWMIARLVRRLRIEQRLPPPRDAVCHGTLLLRSST